MRTILDRINNFKFAFSRTILDYWCALLVCPALFLYIFSNDLNIISLNGLVYRKLCLREYNKSICDSIRNYSTLSNHIQELSSEQLIWLNASFLIPAIFAIIHMASIGDRKLNYELPLMVSLIGSLAQTIVCIFATDQPTDLCISLLILSQVLNGICGGGSLAFISSCFSHISLYEDKITDENGLLLDLNQPKEIRDAIKEKKKNRSIRYSVCETFLLLGQFLGSFLSGYIIGNKTEIKNFQRTYIISLSLYFFVLIYVIVMFQFLKTKKKNIYMSDRRDMSFNPNDMANSDQSLSESEQTRNDHEIRQVANGSKCNGILEKVKGQFSFIFETWYLLSKNRPNNGRFHILSLLLMYFLGASISMGIMSLQYLYLIKKPISFTQISYGIFRALNTFFRAISLLIVLPILKHYFSVPDYVLYIIGLTSEFLNLVVFSIAHVFSYIIWTGPVAYMFSNYFVVCIRSFGSKIVEKNEIGKLFGIIGIVEFLVLLISSTIFSIIYKATVSTFSPMVFLIGCGICIFICFPFLIYIIKDLRKYQTEDGYAD